VTVSGPSVIRPRRTVGTSHGMRTLSRGGIGRTGTSIRRLPPMRSVATNGGDGRRLRFSTATTAWAVTPTVTRSGRMARSRTTVGRRRTSSAAVTTASTAAAAGTSSSGQPNATPHT
jgi:hypothetical protein